MFISLIFFLFAYNEVLPFATSFFITKSNKLRKFQDELILPEYKLDDVLTEDVMFPAWNFETEVPYLFSKVGAQKNPDSEYQSSLGDMIYAS